MQRRYVLLSLLFALTIVAVYNAGTAEGGSVGSILAMIIRGSAIGLGVVAFLGTSLLIQHWMSRSEAAARPAVARAVTAEFPGRFKVIGVDQESGLRTSEFVIADSAEQAATKVSLKGVNVKAVERA